MLIKWQKPPSKIPPSNVTPSYFSIPWIWRYCRYSWATVPHRQRPHGHCTALLWCIPGMEVLSQKSLHFSYFNPTPPPHGTTLPLFVKSMRITSLVVRHWNNCLLGIPASNTEWFLSLGEFVGFSGKIAINCHGAKPLCCRINSINSACFSSRLNFVQ